MVISYFFRTTNVNFNKSSTVIHINSNIEFVNSSHFMNTHILSKISEYELVRHEALRTYMAISWTEKDGPTKLSKSATSVNELEDFITYFKTHNSSNFYTLYIITEVPKDTYDKISTSQLKEGEASITPCTGTKIKFSKEVMRQAEKIKKEKPIKLEKDAIKEEKNDMLVRRSTEIKKEPQHDDESLFDNENLDDLNMQTNEVRNVRTITIKFID